jgi:hypothetical protein
MSENGDAPCFRNEETENRLYSRRFSGPIWAEKSDDFAGVHGEIQAVDDTLGFRKEAFFITDTQVLHSQRGRPRRGGATVCRVYHSELRRIHRFHALTGRTVLFLG